MKFEACLMYSEEEVRDGLSLAVYHSPCVGHHVRVRNWRGCIGTSISSLDRRLPSEC